MAKHIIRSSVVLLVCIVGCGQRTTQTPVSAPAAEKVEIALPEWAPENPSPEFLRAAKVLKPMPEESFNSPEDRAEAVTWLRYQQTLAAGFEFFGTLTDE